MVVVDTAEHADIIIATRIKRTGKQVDLASARRAAEARGVPFVVLQVRIETVLLSLGGGSEAGWHQGRAKRSVAQGGDGLVRG